jgi:hypothetical protein
MPNNMFDKVQINAQSQQRSFRWYQEQVKKLGRVTSNRLMNETKQTNTITAGKMYLFVYNPKHKDTLPYYDTFPLVIPFEKITEGFLGFNLHYLPYAVRFKVLGYLNNLALDDNINEQTKVNVSWKTLSTLSRLNPLKVCVKHYLTNHMESSFFNIPYNDWLIASQLPVENFKKKSKQEVWEITEKKYNG